MAVVATVVPKVAKTVAAVKEAGAVEEAVAKAKVASSAMMRHIG